MSINGKIAGACAELAEAMAEQDMPAITARVTRGEGGARSPKQMLVLAIVDHEPVIDAVISELRKMMPAGTFEHLGTVRMEEPDHA